MALEIKKTNKETSQSLARRFSRRIKRSGILVQVKKSHFRKRKKSNQMKKRAALRREQLREEYRKLDKLGQLKKKYGGSQ